MARPEHSKLVILLLASRPKFLTASAAPVLVGSALGYATTDTFQPVLFILAMLAIMALHAGANIANDYFDHTSGNDWLNRNPTPFSGGRRWALLVCSAATFIPPHQFASATAASANSS